MIRHHLFRAAFIAVLGLALANCDRAAVPKRQDLADLGAQAVRGGRPDSPKGACFAKDETPAVIETVTDQIAEAASDKSDAGYRVETRQKIVQPREEIWFRTPCPEALTPEVIATLQRALAARGLYMAETSGSIDAATRSAIRAYQGPRGLNSDRLSLAAARELGVVAADFGQIESQ